MGYKITKKIPAHIFRGYDIRGVMDKELNPDVYYTFGRAYATWLAVRRITDCSVGADNRITSKDYKKA